MMSGRCTFSDEDGRGCAETGALEFDHIDGFARRRSHGVEAALQAAFASCATTGRDRREAPQYYPTGPRAIAAD